MGTTRSEFNLGEIYTLAKSHLLTSTTLLQANFAQEISDVLAQTTLQVEYYTIVIYFILAALHEENDIPEFRKIQDSHLQTSKEAVLGNFNDAVSQFYLAFPATSLEEKSCETLKRKIIDSYVGIELRAVIAATSQITGFTENVELQNLLVLQPQIVTAMMEKKPDGTYLASPGGVNLRRILKSNYTDCSHPTPIASTHFEAFGFPAQTSANLAESINKSNTLARATLKVKAIEKGDGPLLTLTTSNSLQTYEPIPTPRPPLHPLPPEEEQTLEIPPPVDIRNPAATKSQRKPSHLTFLPRQTLLLSCPTTGGQRTCKIYRDTVNEKQYQAIRKEFDSEVAEIKSSTRKEITFVAVVTSSPLSPVQPFEQEMQGLAAYSHYTYEKMQKGASPSPLCLSGHWDLNTILTINNCCLAQGNRFEFGDLHSGLSIRLSTGSVFRIPQGKGPVEIMRFINAEIAKLSLGRDNSILIRDLQKLLTQVEDSQKLPSVVQEKYGRSVEESISTLEKTYFQQALSELPTSLNLTTMPFSRSTPPTSPGGASTFFHTPQAAPAQTLNEDSNLLTSSPKNPSDFF